MIDGRCEYVLYLHNRDLLGVTLSFESKIPYGNYAGVNLAPALQTALRQHLIMNDGNYAVTFDVNTGLLKITNDGTGTRHIATISQLLSTGSWGRVDLGQNPQYANDVICYDSNATATALTIQLNNMAMLIPVQNVYLTSSEFGMMNQNQSTTGDTNILRRIPVDQPWGNLIKSAINITGGWVDANGTQLDTLSFLLRDPYGRLCDMKGLHISFPICLTNKEIV